MKKRICALMLVMAVMGTMCACGLEPKSSITDRNNVTEGNNFTDDANYESEPEAEEPKADSFDAVYSDKHDFDEADLAMTFEQVKEIYKDIEPTYDVLLESGRGEIKYNCTFEGIPGKVTYDFTNGKLRNIYFESEESEENHNDYYDKLLAYIENRYDTDRYGRYVGVSPANNRGVNIKVDDCADTGYPYASILIIPSPFDEWEDIFCITKPK